MILLSDISVIIPAHEYSQVLFLALQSYEKLKEKPLEIIVVLDGISIDEMYFSSFNLPIIPIQTDKQKGPANARNLGASIAKGKLLYFSDSDVAIKKETFPQILHYFNSNNVDALIGSYDDKPLVLSPISKYRNLLHYYVHQHSSPNANTFWGACGTIKKDIFDELNGFDSSFIKPSVEDIEFGYRLKLKNYTIRLEKTIQVKHLKAWTLLSVIKTDLFQRAIPWTQLLLEHHQLRETNLNVSLSEKIAVLFVSLLILSFLFSFLSIKFLFISLFLAISLLLFKHKLYGFFYAYFPFYLMPLIICYHWLFLITAMIGYLIGYTKHIIKKINE